MPHAAQLVILGCLRALALHELVGDVRGVSLIAAVELVADKASKEPWGRPGALGARVNGLMQQNGVLTRAMGDALAICPPLIVTEAQVDAIVDALASTLDVAAKEVGA